MNMHKQAYDWYFETVYRVYLSGRYSDHNTAQSRNLTGKQVLKVDRAIQSGNFEEIRDLIPVTHETDAQQRFHNLIKLRDFPLNNIAAGRSYVSAFFDFNRYVHNLSSNILSGKDR